MNYQLNAGPKGVFETGMFLHALINEMISSSVTTSLRNKICIVNDVSPDIYVIADKTKVISIIDALLTMVIENVRNSQIYLTADRFRDIIILNIQDRNNNNGYALSFSKCLSNRR